MKALKILPKSTEKKEWSLKVVCGKVAPPKVVTNGCGSEFEIIQKDLFSKPFQMQGYIGVSIHWRCPNCYETNWLEVDTVKDLSVPSQTKYLYLQNLKDELFVEIAQLYPNENKWISSSEKLEELADEFNIPDVHLPFLRSKL